MIKIGPKAQQALWASTPHNSPSKFLAFFSHSRGKGEILIFEIDQWESRGPLNLHVEGVVMCVL